jgi:hypothetical protein
MVIVGEEWRRESMYEHCPKAHIVAGEYVPGGSLSL